MNSKDKDTLLNSILDIQGDRYKIAQAAMGVINEMIDNFEETSLEKIKVKPALYALQNILDKDDSNNNNNQDN